MVVSMRAAVLAVLSLAMAGGGRPIVQDELLSTVRLPNGRKMALSVGFGSGAFHCPKDAANVVYTVTDRGPNIDVEDAVRLLGFDPTGGQKGKIFPLHRFHPSIYKLEVGDDSFRVLSRLKFRDVKGNPLTGLPNPLTVTDVETAFKLDGSVIRPEPGGLDPEAIVALPDGTFWVSEEYGPSLVHVDSRGSVRVRLVPESVEGDLKKAHYDVRGDLPKIFRKRKLNRGFEALALSPSGKYLYTMPQSPLANPDRDAFEKSRNVRLLQIDRESHHVVGEYVYRIDKEESFVLDPGSRQRDVRVSEMAATGEEELLILERIERTTKLYRVDLKGATNIARTKWDKEKTSPSLEEIKKLADVSIEPVSKELVFDSSVDAPGLPAKIEGMALLGGDEVLLVSDNDFGIAGDSTSLIRVRLR